MNYASALIISAILILCVGLALLYNDKYNYVHTDENNNVYAIGTIIFGGVMFIAGIYKHYTDDNYQYNSLDENIFIYKAIASKIENEEIDEKRASVHLGQKYYNEFVKETVTELNKSIGK